MTSVFSFFVFVYIQNDKWKNGSLTSVFRFGLLYLPKKKLSFDFLVNLGHLGVFHGHKQLFSVQNCENVEKDMLETKTVCSFEIFKKGKQNNSSVLLFFVLYLGEVDQKY